MNKILLAGKYLLIFCPFFAIAGNGPGGARSAGIAGSSVTFSDLWSLQNNQAGLAFIERSSAGSYYGNRFLLKELGTSVLNMALLSKYGTFGSTITYFGFPAYNEQKIALAYARKYGDKFSAGMQFNYERINIRGYGKKALLTIEAGMLAKVHKDLVFGFQLYNPAGAKLTSDERSATTAKAGLQYIASAKVLLVLEAEKTTGIKANVKGGVEYKIHKQLTLRGGFGSSPLLAAAGFSIIHKSLQLEMAFDHHQYTGFSPHCSFTYVF